jgi:hypothetical protein
MYLRIVSPPNPTDVRFEFGPDKICPKVLPRGLSAEFENIQGLVQNLN